MYLIEWLEADRQHTEEVLHKERRRKRFLENKVESRVEATRAHIGCAKGSFLTIKLCYVASKQRTKCSHSVLTTTSFLEHEGCIRDIAELKWQLKVERVKLNQAQETFAHWGVKPGLYEDFSFAKNPNKNQHHSS